MKEIEIYSLGEWEVFWAVIHNFLGWAHESSYNPPSLKPISYDPQDRFKELLQKVAEKDGKLHIHHFFEPFVASEFPQYQRMYFDNGMRLIKLIRNTKGLAVNWDIMDYEKDILLRNSPPLFYAIFGDK